jgi:CheY-like chemotaxis protein
MTDKGGRVLVAEDDTAMAYVIRFTLQRAGLHVKVADCGRSAWNMLKNEDFDLVLSDLLMPGMTGDELCRKIRADPGLATIPVIILTVKGFELDRAHYLRDLCVSAVISKPFSPQELVRTVEQHLAVGAVGP